MAKYTITLKETISLFTDEQAERYTAILQSCAPTTDIGTKFIKAFNVKYYNREISNGTPEGFLNDIEETALVYGDLIKELFTRYEKYGYYTSQYMASDTDTTETPDLKHTRTPNITRTRTPNLTTTDDGQSVFSDTPDSSGVVTGNYATNVNKVDNTTTVKGSDENKETGTDTTTETGTKNIHSVVTVETPVPSLSELTEKLQTSLMAKILDLFANNFMLIY